jgi:hypothetical protein
MHSPGFPPQTSRPSNPPPQDSSVLPQHNHCWKRIILELSVTLKTDKAFDKFAQALVVFMVNAKMVDPSFVRNPINPNAIEVRNITLNDKIPNSMTTLSSHVKVSKNGYSFVKQRIHKEGKNKRRLQAGHRNNNKGPKDKDPMVYFNFIALSDVDPTKIISWTMYKLTGINVHRLQIKDLP